MNNSNARLHTERHGVYFIANSVSLIAYCLYFFIILSAYNIQGSPDQCDTGPDKTQCDVEVILDDVVEAVGCRIETQIPDGGIRGKVKCGKGLVTYWIRISHTAPSPE